jgi:hypothetical protein|uniref:Uncharacterized protein n=1 Tax=Sipha flava TaxID=143950 RepID=A0A2S2QVM7_9HEMI
MTVASSGDSIVYINCICTTRRRTGIDCIDVIQYIETRLIQSFCRSHRGRHIFFCEHENCSGSCVRIRPFNLTIRHCITLCSNFIIIIYYWYHTQVTNINHYNIINYIRNIIYLNYIFYYGNTEKNRYTKLFV